MNDLFSDHHTQCIEVSSRQGELHYWPNWIGSEKAGYLMQQLMQSIPWQSESIQMFGRKTVVPRLVAWIGDAGKSYRYSGVEHAASPWTSELFDIKSRIEEHFECSINSVLCNLYRNGHDSMGWHSDNEPELGSRPSIYSISLGEPRFFDCRLKSDHSIKHRLALTAGSLVVMKGDFQNYWEHQIPKQRRVTEPRINLTFRYIVGR